MKHTHIQKLWGAAFTETPSEAAIAFTAGRDVAVLPMADAVLLPYDLWVNQAHVVMLAKTGIIPLADARTILSGLISLEQLVAKDRFLLDPTKEDVHTNIESYLTDKLGIQVAGKLHTARSRNDQVVTDMKLYLRDQVLSFVQESIGLTETLLTSADAYKHVPMPGFTHHQHAMVTTFGHCMAGFAEMVLRDIARLECWYGLHNKSPLGNAASYGTTYPIDRAMTAALLDFDSADHNSLDAITNRWESEADLAFAVTVLMSHLSGIAETLILFSTPEFGMVTISDAYSMGSSIMPQKKNPSTLEAIKAKASYAQGQLTGLLSLGKGLFIGYNNDSQWSKYLIMDLLRECMAAPAVLSGTISTMTVHGEVMTSWCHKGHIGAATVMEQIAQTEHMPMREAKIAVETMVKDGAGDKVAGYDAWQQPETILSLTKSYGSPGKHSMKKSLKAMRHQHAGHRYWLADKKHKKQQALTKLSMMIDSIRKGGETL